MIARLQRLKNTLGGSWSELAYVLNISRNTLSAIRSGKRNPSTHVAFMISIVEERYGIWNKHVSIVVTEEFRTVIASMYKREKKEAIARIFHVKTASLEKRRPRNIKAIAEDSYRIFKIELSNRNWSFSAWARSNGFDPKAARKELLTYSHKGPCRTKMYQTIESWKKG